MSNRLDKFNTLPPKPEYLKRVRSVLHKTESSQKLSTLVAHTGLTKTQVLCSLDLMVRNGEVIKETGTLSFRRTERMDKLG